MAIKPKFLGDYKDTSTMPLAVVGFILSIMASVKLVVKEAGGLEHLRCLRAVRRSRLSIVRVEVWRLLRSLNCAAILSEQFDISHS